MDSSKKKLNYISVAAFILSLFSIFYLAVYIKFYVKGVYLNLILALSFSVISIIVAIIAFITIIRKHQKGKVYAIFAVIIGIAPILLYTLTFFNGVHGHSRDRYRFSDIKQIQTALELYKNDLNRYPENLEFGGKLAGEDFNYMERVPKDRLPNDGDCPPNFRYKYTALNNGESYTLEYCLGMPVAGLEAGYHTATPKGITTSP